MKARGFTLMEMIVTIVIGSFIMLGIAGYNKGSGINKPPNNFLMANIMSNIKS